MKISQLSSYAVRLLIAMEQNEAKHVSAATLAQHTHIPLPTVSKVLKSLAKAGIVSSVLGAGGGYFLTQQIDNITLGDIMTAVEGPLKVTPCVDEDCKTCEETDICTTKGKWSSVNQHVLKSLNTIKLVDMIGN